MPFTLPERRNQMLAGILTDIQSGDRCFLHYHRMVTTFKAKPSWTTVSQLYEHVRITGRSCEQQYAEELAWQVFFIKYVMPYEDKKEQENGTI
jgi:hypothetical protein